MVVPSVGKIVLVHFSFSDLSRSKLGPAFILTDSDRNEWILCQVTSQSYADSTAVEITTGDLSSGLLRKTSSARPGKLFTANSGITTKEIGELKPEKLEEIIRDIISMFNQSIV